MPIGSGPAFHLEATAQDTVMIRARSAERLAPSVRRLAWFVVVAGLTGEAGLAVLRVPLPVHLLFLSFFTVAAVVVWYDARTSGVQLNGQLRVDTKGLRLVRIEGFAAFTWDELALPDVGALVIDTMSLRDAKRFISGIGRPCVISAVPADSVGVEAAWNGLASGQPPPDGVPIVDGIDYDVARALAEALSRALRWPILDLASAEPERRSPEDLDAPILSRIGALFGELPDPTMGRKPWGATQWSDPVGTHLALRSASLPTLVFQAAVAVPLLTLLFLFSGGNAGIPTFGAALLALSFGGRTHVTLTPDGAVLQTVVIWMPLGEQRITRWSDIEQVQVLAQRGLCGVRLVGHWGSAFIPAPTRRAARWTAGEIRRYLHGLTVEACGTARIAGG